MQHIKIYHSQSLRTAPDQPEIIIEGPVSPEKLQELTMHTKLDAFPQTQRATRSTHRNCGIT